MRQIPSLARIVLFFTWLITLSTQLSADAMKETLFSDVNKAIADANAVTANILSPVSYGKAKKLYDRADDRYEKGQSIERIKKELAEATGLFKKATDNSAIAKLTFENVLKARDDAAAAEASARALKNWTEAEQKFSDAARSLELGSLKRAKDKISSTEALYRKAELNAIKASYLSETKALIDQATNKRVVRYAPKTLENASTLLASAEKELNENRYDTDYPRSLAKQARYEAKHAIYIASRVKLLQNEDVSAEDILLKSEEPLTAIASLLDLNVQFHNGFDDPTKAIKARIEGLLKDSYELGERKKEIEFLETEIATLEKRLGIQSERIAKQEAQKNKLREVTGLFSKNEAIVLRQGNNVLLRLIGLTFNPGSSTIATRNFQLLNRVQKAIDMYPEFRVIIEGHTDSFGSDATNHALSTDRAKAVREYIIANMNDRLPTDIEAIGFGETRPIANNETQDGRAKNRRIDLVLVPNA